MLEEGSRALVGREKGYSGRDPLKRLDKIRKKKTRIALGLMSGTSVDGIDAVLAEISGRGLRTGARILAFETHPFEPPMKRRILKLFSAGAEEICEMNFIIGELLADAALKLMCRTGTPPREVDFIGSHGQTLYHLSGHPRRKNSTLQIGEGAVIAARTGVVTVCDFRPADISAGGTGAPLVPYADYLLFRKKGKVRALLNLGGIANVTVLPGKLEEVMAFDIGPGNVVVGSLLLLRSRGRMKWDPEGRLAGRGRINEELLGDLMRHPYFQLSPPKSTGRELFGEEFAKDLWGKKRRLSLEDLLATATFFTAASIYRGLDDFIFPRFRVDEIFVSGGGVHNQTLMGFLRKVFGPIPIGPLNDLGIDGDAKEALAFALLADATLQGLPSNVPGATGAKRPAVLGKIVL
jgi:anhydro-N-acetylmuramic acid kinase